MLLPIELFHVCVRIHIDISDIRRDRPAAGADEQGRAGRESFRVGYVVVMPHGCRCNVPARQPRASAARRRGLWLWVLGLRVSRALRPTSLAAGGYRVSKTPV